jgi:hypothetical protein
VAIPNVVIVETSGCNVLLDRDIFQNRDQYIILYLLGIPNMGEYSSRKCWWIFTRQQILFTCRG